MNPSSTWTCDVCGEVIKDKRHGWVEWLSRYDNETKAARGLRLVHHMPHSPRKKEGGCQYNGDLEYRRDRMTISDSELPRFTGHDGLMDLLAMIAEGHLPQKEVLEMIKRIHIPGYEQARYHFDAAISDGAFEPNTLEGFYRTSDIEATIAYAKRKEG